MTRLNVLLCLAVSASAAPPVVIQNATVLTITKGTIKNGAILIRDCKFAEADEKVRWPRRSRLTALERPRSATGGRIGSETYDANPFNAAIMVRKGVLVSLNSDDAELMRHLNTEAAKTMKYGSLTENEALSLVTINRGQTIGRWTIALAPSSQAKTRIWRSSTSIPCRTTRRCGRC